MTGGKSKRRGKHKCRERGSLEEEHACKQPNMVPEDSEFIDKETNTEAEEPTCLEPKEM